MLFAARPSLIAATNGAEKAMGSVHREHERWAAMARSRGVPCRPRCLGSLALNLPANPLLRRRAGVEAVGRKYGIVLSFILDYFRQMKLSAWAKANGLAYQTAWRMWRDGKLPVPAEQLPTGTIIVHPPKAAAVDSVAIYARVSSADQKADLERQLGRLAEYASRERLTIIRSVAEIGPGLNGQRAKIIRLLSDPAVQAIVVEHRDRLARFGSEYIEAALAACGRKLIVVDQAEMKDDLVADMVDVLTWFCARLYGRRAAKNRAAKALAAAQAET
jgi:putative resolvase